LALKIPIQSPAQGYPWESAGDWIGIFNANDESTDGYIAFTYVPKQNATVSISVSPVYGLKYFKYISSYKIIGAIQSHDFPIPAEYQNMKLVLNVMPTEAGIQVKIINYETLSAARDVSNDYIALFKEEKKNEIDDYMCFKYVTDSTLILETTTQLTESTYYVKYLTSSRAVITSKKLVVASKSTPLAINDDLKQQFKQFRQEFEKDEKSLTQNLQFLKENEIKEKFLELNLKHLKNITKIDFKFLIDNEEQLKIKCPRIYKNEVNFIVFNEYFKTLIQKLESCIIKNEKVLSAFLQQCHKKQIVFRYVNKMQNVACWNEILFDNGVLYVQCKPTNLWTNLSDLADDLEDHLDV